MSIKISQDTYNTCLQSIQSYEDEINEIYSSWLTYTIEEKRLYLDFIQDLRIIIEELKKVVSIYENESEQNTQDFFKYTVKEGDTLPYLANRFFENDTERWKDIYNDNSLSDSKLSLGQILKIRNS